MIVHVMAQGVAGRGSAPIFECASVLRVKYQERIGAKVVVFGCLFLLSFVVFVDFTRAPMRNMQERRANATVLPSRAEYAGEEGVRWVRLQWGCLAFISDVNVYMYVCMHVRVYVCTYTHIHRDDR